MSKHVALHTPYLVGRMSRSWDNVCKSEGEVVMTLFFDYCGHILNVILEESATINPDHYISTLLSQQIKA